MKINFSLKKHFFISDLFLYDLYFVFYKPILFIDKLEYNSCFIAENIYRQKCCIKDL